MGKVKSGSKLLAALGRTKKEQMKAIMPTGKSLPPGRDKSGRIKGVLMKKPSPPKIKSKGPYTRGKVMGTGDLISRRAAVAGTKALRKVDKTALRDTAIIGAAALAGFGVGKYDSSKKSKAKTHQEKARRGAKELIKKQKAKKEKHHSR